MKIIKYPLIGLVIIILLGIAVQALLPDCRCQLESCRGCGDIGNVLGRLSNGLLALGFMGAAILGMFGVPVLILWLIFSGVYKLFNKSDDDN